MYSVGFEQLEALRAVTDEGSFDAAARRLRLTASAVSQRIKALETNTGRVLLRRSKPVLPTDSGKVLLRLARQTDLLSAQAARDLDAAAEPTRLSIVVNADSLATWVMSALSNLPDDTLIDLHREDEGHSAELLRDGAAMAAVTSVAAPVQGCSSVRLGSMRYRPLASPEYLRRRLPDGPTPEALGRAPLVDFDRKDALQDRYLRGLGVDGSPPRHYVPSSGEFAEAVRLGLGWGMVPDLQSRADLKHGRLLPLAPGDFLDVPLYWQQWKLRSAVLSQVAEAVSAAARVGLR